MVLALPAAAQDPAIAVTQNTQASVPAPAQTAVVDTIPPPPKSLDPREWYAQALSIGSDGSVTHLKGHAQVESRTLIIRADSIDYDGETSEVIATGNVYFHQLDRNEQIWCDHLKYNRETERGQFWDLRGETMPKVVTRRGILSGNSPFYFEGKFAERMGAKYILYQGWMTNCKLPHPWWKMRAPKFEIVPDDHATAYKGTFVFKSMPLFFTPLFYHSLKKEPRKSGFLIPNLVPRSQRGFMVGLGYYWAINRSYDLTYRLYDYNSSALSNHLEFRGKPNSRTDFNLIVTGVYDIGGDPKSVDPKSGLAPKKYTGETIYFTGKSDLGNGWTAFGQVNYISSFRFRQEWTESFNEGIGSETHSVGFISKNWSTYSFDVAAARTENFQPEIAVPAADGTTNYLTNAVLIHKLPEGEFSSRDRQIVKNIPLWFSFDSSAGLLYRSDPIFSGSTLVYNFQTGQFTSRLRFAPRITSAFHLFGVNFTPSVGLDESYYGESQSVQGSLNHVENSDIVRSAHDFTLDIALPSIARVFNKKTIFGDKLKHVVETRATYKYQTGVGTDFDRYIRFDENDLLTNTNELALSLTNRIYAKRGDAVSEIFTWELMQKRYFDPTFGGALVPGQRNVFDATSDVTAFSFLTGVRGTSPVASLLRASPINGLGIQWLADYDARLHRVVNSSFSIDYTWHKYRASIGDDAVHSDPVLTGFANQYRFGALYGDSQHRGWNAAATAVYDVRKGTLLTLTTQVTYNTDCCGFSMEYGRLNFGIRDQPIYRFSFAIANLGTFGTLKKQDRLF